jgi:hypothetical protein
LLELAAHRDQPLGGSRDVLARCAPPPRIGARAPVRKDPPREHEPVLAVGPQLGQRSQGLVVDAVELGLDVRLVDREADLGRVAARAELEPARVRQARLARSGLTGDRVQAGIELELGLVDEHEVRDSESAEHDPIVGAASVGIIGRKWRRTG